MPQTPPTLADRARATLEHALVGLEEGSLILRQIVHYEAIEDPKLGVVGARNPVLVLRCLAELRANAVALVAMRAIHDAGEQEHLRIVAPLRTCESDPASRALMAFPSPDVLRLVVLQAARALQVGEPLEVVDVEEIAETPQKHEDA